MFLSIHSHMLLQSPLRKEKKWKTRNMIFFFFFLVCFVFSRNERRTGHCVLWTSSCCQQQVQRPGSVTVWGCVRALDKGHYTSVMAVLIQKSTLTFNSNMCCLQDHISHMGTHAPLSKTMQNHILNTWQGLAEEDNGTGTRLACLQTWLFPL